MSTWNVALKCLCSDAVTLQVQQLLNADQQLVTHELQLDNNSDM